MINNTAIIAHVEIFTANTIKWYYQCKFDDLICRFSVIDCQVSDWSDWSKCDVACGIGTLTRTREVLRPESNGGRQCPSLEESRSCRATRCSSRQLDKISALKGNKVYNNWYYKQKIFDVQKLN